MLYGYILPSVVTMVLHAAVIWLLSDSWDLERPDRFVKPQMINARLVKLEQAQPAPKPKPKPQQKKPAPKKTPAKKPEPKPALAKQKAEQERRERDRLERERQAAEMQLAVLVAEEEALAQASSQQELAMSHIGAIQQAITNRWNRPASARRKMQVSLLISLIPTGEVVTVRVLDGSGNSAFDRSAINAVNKAGRFPGLADLPPRVFEKYFRELRLVFRPEDLRL